MNFDLDNINVHTKKRDVHPTMSAIHANISINLVNQRDIFDIMRGFYCFFKWRNLAELQTFLWNGLQNWPIFFCLTQFSFMFFWHIFFIYMSSTCYSFWHCIAMRWCQPIVTSYDLLHRYTGNFKIASLNSTSLRRFFLVYNKLEGINRTFMHFEWRVLNRITNVGKSSPLFSSF